MKDRVRLALALLLEAEEEGEDEEFAKLVEKASRRLGEGLGSLVEELGDLLDLPPRVALWRLMNTDGWREALEEASKKLLELKLSEQT